MSIILFINRRFILNKLNKKRAKKITLIEIDKSDLMAPPVWLEQTTLRLTAACSTDWAKEEYKCWHCSIFPGSHPPSIFDTDELNYCVRNGNRWDLIAINTDYLIKGQYPQNWTRNNFCEPRTLGQALDRLVLPSWICHHTYTCNLSTL